MDENELIIKKILEAIGKPVAFKYPGNEGEKNGILKDRSVYYQESGKGKVPYWDVVELIEFKDHEEMWIRVGYYRKPEDRLVWGSQTTITEPISTWKNLLVNAAKEKEWFRALLKEVIKELG